MDGGLGVCRCGDRGGVLGNIDKIVLFGRDREGDLKIGGSVHGAEGGRGSGADKLAEVGVALEDPACEGRANDGSRKVALGLGLGSEGGGEASLGCP